jgi:hypothetical protein
MFFLGKITGILGRNIARGRNGNTENMWQVVYYPYTVFA